MNARAAMSLAALVGGTGVAAGAFGAHALARILPPARLATYQTAVLSQLVHALALGLVGAWGQRAPSPQAATAAALFAVGLTLFSGSLYVVALAGVGVAARAAPLGGLALVAGWAMLAWAAWTG